MYKITLLGAGLIGKTIARELSTHHIVTVIDINADRLEALNELSYCKTIQADINDANKLKSLLGDADLVVGAVPGFMGFNMLKNVIKAKKNIVDISFFPEDPFVLDALAKEYNVTAIVDCGVAPGLDNLILGYYHAHYKVTEFECYVGGLPFVRNYPFAYKAPFSPIDVIEEYTRPARMMRDGKMTILPALSETEMIDFPEVGTLQAFNTDGLRTLLRLPIPNMKEKTLRYPGHVTYIRALQNIGFFKDEIIEVRGMKVRPIDVTSEILLPQWKLLPEDEEFTIMDTIVKYDDKGESKVIKYHLFDVYDKDTKTHSMSRTTGYTCTAIANLVLDKKFNKYGIFAGEHIGMEEGLFTNVIQYLEKKNVKMQII